MNHQDEPHPSETRPPLIRWLWLTAGGFFLLLGVIGAFLPVLPTVPFVLLAAVCFTRGSKKLHHWLRNHPRFGPPLRDWEDGHCIPRRARNLALIMMWTSLSVSAWLMYPRLGWLTWLLPATAAAVSVYMLRLPLREDKTSAKAPTTSDD